jgi:hygromycin-B 4-O-kinase
MPAIDPAAILQFLRTHFHPRAASVTFIGSGWFSHAYAFAADERPYVFRLNTYKEDFQKDAFAHRHFSSPQLPIPRVLRIGRFDDTYHYAITERCEGLTISAMAPDAILAILPALFDALSRIHAIDVSTTTGWGAERYRRQWPL